MTRSTAQRRSWRSSSSRNGRPPTRAIAFGPSVTARMRVPAPPHNTITSGLLCINLTPFPRQHFVVHLLRFIYDDLTALVGKPERNAKQLGKPAPQLRPPFG